MNGVNSQFQEDLADLADLARPVDLRDQVLHGSRRQSQRRAVLVSLAAVVVVAAGGSAIALAAHPSGNGVPAVQPTASVTDAPSPNASPTPGNPAGSRTPGTSNGSARLMLGPWTKSGGRFSLPGTLYYLTGGNTGQTKINVLADNQLRTAALQGPVGPNDCARQSIVFSPDGASVAWVESEGQATDHGALVVASLEGGGSTVVLPDPVQCRGGSGPKWMPDSRGLVATVVRRGRDEVNIVDVNTGATTAAPAAWGSYLAWSANGAYVAYGKEGRIVVNTAAGALVKQAPYDINCCTGGFSVQSVSDDGRYVGVSFLNSDPDTVRNAMKIVDMTTGKDVDLGMTPPPGGSISIILVGADRLFSTVVGTSTDVTLDPAGAQEDISIPVTGHPQIRAYRP